MPHQGPQGQIKANFFSLSVATLRKCPTSYFLGYSFSILTVTYDFTKLELHMPLPNWINENLWFIYCSIIHLSRHRFPPWFYIIVYQFVVVDIRKFKACQVFLRLMTEWLTFNGRIHIPNGMVDLLFIFIFFTCRISA